MPLRFEGARYALNNAVAVQVGCGVRLNCEGGSASVTCRVVNGGAWLHREETGGAGRRQVDERRLY